MAEKTITEQLAAWQKKYDEQMLVANEVIARTGCSMHLAELFTSSGRSVDEAVAMVRASEAARASKPTGNAPRPFYTEWDARGSRTGE